MMVLRNLWSQSKAPDQKSVEPTYPLGVDHLLQGKKPAQVLALSPLQQRTGGKPDDGQTEISGVQVSEGNLEAPTTSIENLSDVSGVHPTISGVHDALLTTASETNGAERRVNDNTVTATHPVETDVTERANSGDQNNVDTLPDLVMNSAITDTNTASNLQDFTAIPPIGEIPPIIYSMERPQKKTLMQLMLFSALELHRPTLLMTLMIIPP